VFKGARLKLPCTWCCPFYVLLLRKTIRVQFYHTCVEILKQVLAGERKRKHKTGDAEKQNTKQLLTLPLRWDEIICM
jgi:hypothetical protein